MQYIKEQTRRLGGLLVLSLVLCAWSCGASDDFDALVFSKTLLFRHTSITNGIAAIKKLGGSPRYTEYKGADHDIWIRTFKEPGLADWLFAQHK